MHKNSAWHERAAKILAVYRQSVPFERPSPPMAMLPQFIDHALLKPETSEDKIFHLCQKARRESFYAVYLNPCWLPLAHPLFWNALAVIQAGADRLGTSSGRKIPEQVRGVPH